MHNIELENREIALIGVGRHCKHFYMQFRNILNIKYLLYTNFNQASPLIKSYFAEKQGVEYVPFNEAGIREKKLLLILCVGHEIRKRYDKLLFNKGFEWGADYVDSLYVIQHYRIKNDIKIENKDIWIFGAGNNGRKFYDKYKDIYSISGFVSNFAEEREFQGLPVIRPEDIPGLKEFYVVVCSDAENEMVNKLDGLGCAGNITYGFEDMLPGKLFIAIGSCQIARVAEILDKNSGFAGYTLCVYRDSMYAPCSEADNCRLKAYGAFCDVVFYSSANAATIEQRNYEPLLNKYFVAAKRLSIPFYYFTGQLMQASEMENPYTVARHQQYFWLRGDKEINNMVEKGLTIEEVRQQVASQVYWDREDIVRHFHKELKKIEIMDRFSTFPIKNFIERNYRDMMIFNDDTHFGCRLSMYLADKLAECLGIEPMDSGLLEEIEREERSVMPLYPCVRQALEMNIKGDARIYNVEEGRIESKDIESYAELYYKYVVNVRSIYKGLGTIF